MNNIYANTIKKEGKASLTAMGWVLLVLAIVLFLQSRAFNSSLWVLLQFSYDTWQEYLWRILKYLIVWAAMTGVIFALEFGAAPANTDPKRFFTSLVVGFVNGFTFTYFLVLALGILILIPLGLFSLVVKDIIEYASLEFALLASAYIVFLWIALDTPALLMEGIRHGKWSVKFLAGSLMLMLASQVFGVLLSLLRIILESCQWIHGWQPGILFVFGSLVVTFVAIRKLAGPLPLRGMVFPILGVYIASIAAGNLSQIFFDWGELPSALVAAFVGPVIFSMGVRSIIKHGVAIVFGIIGTFAGMLTGLWFAQFAKLRIIGNGWFGVVCGVSFAIVFGIALGGMWSEAVFKTLSGNTRLKPEIIMSIGLGVFVGIILGMVVGGFMAR